MPDNDILTDPFFWALLSAVGMGAGNTIVADVLPRSRFLGALVVASVMLGRILLVLPFCPQPRFELAGLHWPLGLVLIGAGAAFVLPVSRVHWTTAPDASERLRSTGVYGLVRHPAYLGNIVLCLGWAVAFRSTVGVALTVLWWLSFWLHARIEEASLLRTYGADYEAYKRRVPWRIIPWTHFHTRVAS
ncbi:MAG: isoprenylcysteine carboxylmethyltransferase family protein [bacterium]|nr:isoprenylcysteine carboxylmethyltransferase family protein [bacterium]